MLKELQVFQCFAISIYIVCALFDDFDLCLVCEVNLTLDDTNGTCTDYTALQGDNTFFRGTCYVGTIDPE